MTRPFTYDRRYSYFDQQDVAPDHRYALMRYSGKDTVADLIHDAMTRIKPLYKARVWDGVGKNYRPDRKRMKRSHRA